MHTPDTLTMKTNPIIDTFRINNTVLPFEQLVSPALAGYSGVHIPDLYKLARLNEVKFRLNSTIKTLKRNQYQVHRCYALEVMN